MAHRALPAHPWPDRRALVLAGWCGVAAALAAAAALLAWASPYFTYAVAFRDLPAAALAFGTAAAGCVYLLLPWLIHASPRAPGRAAVAAMLAVGFALRLILITSEPALEDDYHRYLWDGAVVAHGLNPYGLSPAEAKAAPAGSALAHLAAEAGVILSRVNNPELKTIYPPVAEAAFALAHWLQPWSLAAWRAVCLAGELVTIALMLWLLARAGRSPLWAALYWWNPLVVKEIANAAHMEAILMPLVLGAIALSVTGRNKSAMGVLGLAIGAKLWPALLAPLLLRPLLAEPRRLVVPLAILAGLVATLALPVLAGGLDASSGFVAYGQRWRTNSASLLLAEAVTGIALAPFKLSEPALDLAARALLAGLVLLVVLLQCRRPWRDPACLLSRCVVVAGAVALLGPAQFPWYMIWVLALVPFRPWLGVLAATALAPLYYLSFHYLARDNHALFTGTIVWFIWVPVWLLLGLEAVWRHTAWRRWRAPPVVRAT